MAPHSSTVAQKIPWMEEPGRLLSMGSLRVGHDWATSLSLSTFNEYSGLISSRIDWFDPLAVQGILESLLQQPSLKASILQHSTFFKVQLAHPYMTIGKTVALTWWTFVGKVMSLLSNMLSRLVIAFLPRSKCLNFMAAVTIFNDFEAQENKICTVSIVSPSICHEVMGLDAMIFVFWMLSFKSAFHALFHFHQEALQFLYAFCRKDGIIFISEIIDISKYI